MDQINEKYDCEVGSSDTCIFGGQELNDLCLFETQYTCGDCGVATKK